MEKRYMEFVYKMTKITHVIRAVEMSTVDGNTMEDIKKNMDNYTREIIATDITRIEKVYQSAETITDLKRMLEIDTVERIRNVSPEIINSIFDDVNRYMVEIGSGLYDEFKTSLLMGRYREICENVSFLGIVSDSEGIGEDDAETSLNEIGVSK